jgi:AbrB family looped-hinge helix DNA binding protein
MKNRAHCSIEDCFYGSVTVGERGQIVIPAEAREEQGIRAGDKLLVMRHPVFNGLVVAKFESIKDFHEDFMGQVEAAARREEKSE